MTLSKHTLAIIRKIVLSKNLDVLGVMIVVLVTIYKGFHTTIFSDGAVVTGSTFDEMVFAVQNGALPLGLLSVVGAMLSMLSTRLVGKQRNLGNVFNIIISVTSGGLDYLFGNRTAVITYPMTFALASFATYNWHKGERIRKRDSFYYVITALGILISFIVVFVSAHYLGGKTDLTFLIVLSLAFGISLGGTFCGAFKYEDTAFNWIIYNILQLAKNSMILNWANVAKYIFYLINAAVTLIDWKFNGDQDFVIVREKKLLEK